MVVQSTGFWIMHGGTARHCPSALFTSPPPVSTVLTVQLFGELHQKALWEVAQTKGSQTTSSWPSVTEFTEVWHMATSAVSKDEPGVLSCFTHKSLPRQCWSSRLLLVMLQKRFLNSPVLRLHRETGKGCKLQCCTWVLPVKMDKLEKGSEPEIFCFFC